MRGQTYVHHKQMPTTHPVSKAGAMWFNSKVESASICHEMTVFYMGIQYVSYSGTGKTATNFDKNPSSSALSVNLLLLQRIVSQELLNQVNMSQHHSTTTVSLQLQLVQSITFSHGIILQVLQICFPLITNNLPTGKTTNWNNHTGVSTVATVTPRY